MRAPLPPLALLFVCLAVVGLAHDAAAQADLISRVSVGRAWSSATTRAQATASTQLTEITSDGSLQIAYVFGMWLSDRSVCSNVAMACVDVAIGARTAPIDGVGFGVIANNLVSTATFLGARATAQQITVK